MEKSVARELWMHFDDMVEVYKLAMKEHIKTFEDMLRVKRSAAEELQEKVRLVERHAATERANTLVETVEAS